MAAEARIVCVDLDTFFVSVERLLDPSLVGKPVVVGAAPGGRGGVVTSASYEVRALGVRSGMSVADAVLLAPDAIFLPTRHGVYSAYAEQVKDVLLTGTDVVQTASIDEFFLDFHGCERLWARPGDLDADATVVRRVREIRDDVEREVGLPASAGIATTRPLAKMASRLAKPAGVFTVPSGGELAFVAPQSVRAWPGIGPVSEAGLVDAGILTLGDLLTLAPGRLRARFGGLAERVRLGMDGDRNGELGRDRPAFHEHDPVGLTLGSISNERTLGALRDPVRVEDQLRGLAERVCWRARRRRIVARTVALKLRTLRFASGQRQFHTITRSRTGPPSAADGYVFACVRELLEGSWARSEPVRLLGVVLSNLEAAHPQLALPFGAGPEDRPPVQEAIDAVRDRFGYDAIRLGAIGRTSWLN
jgi:DNA polymerase IV